MIRHPTPFKAPPGCLTAVGMAVIMAGGLVMTLWLYLQVAPHHR